MANAAAYKTTGTGFRNQVNHIEFEYDFANDGGAVGTIKLGKFEQKCLVRKASVHVLTACTSGGSATVKIGTSTGDDDAFLDTTSGAVGSLTLNAVVEETAGQSLIVAADEDVEMVIAVAALTAGKIRVYVEYILVD